MKGRLLIKKKTFPYFKDEMSLSAGQLVHLSRPKKGRVFFLIGNQSEIMKLGLYKNI